jgi:N-formylglutamate amidohydrolase
MFEEEIKEKILIHVPHAGNSFPSFIGYVDDGLAMSENNLLVDDKTDEIFSGLGIGQVVFPYSRVFCDVERFLENEEMESKGMGFFYTHCDDGRLLRTEEFGNKNVVRCFYEAHHKLLEMEIQKRIDKGFCYLIDAHSFSDIPFNRDQNQKKPRPDICIGTTEKNTPDYLVEHFRNKFQQNGFSVSLNEPYSGSMVPKKFYDDKRFASIMIEINRKFTYSVKLRETIRSAFDFSSFV